MRCLVLALGLHEVAVDLAFAPGEHGELAADAGLTLEHGPEPARPSTRPEAREAEAQEDSDLRNGSSSRRPVGRKTIAVGAAGVERPAVARGRAEERADEVLSDGRPLDGRPPLGRKRAGRQSLPADAPRSAVPGGPLL